MVVGLAFVVGTALPTAALLQTADPGTPPSPVASPGDPSVDLNQQIVDKKAKADDLQKRLDAYEKNLDAAASKRGDLVDDVANLDGQIQDVQLRLETTTAQVEVSEAQVAKVQADLAAKEQDYESTLERLGGLIRTLNAEEQISPLTLTLTAHSISEVFRSLSAGSEVYGEVKQTLDAVRSAQEALTLDRDTLTGQLAQLAQVRGQQQSLNDALEQQQTYKTALLENTRKTETKLAQLITSVRDEANAVNAEIVSLEDRARSAVGDTSLGTGNFRWPVLSIKGISAYFHDPTYPFRCTVKNPSNCIGEHNAIDIPTPQGTPVKAADDGYVAIARKLDWVRNSAGRILYPAYNYVALLHANGMSTVYGHLSQVLVNQDTYVRQGEVIATSGATPGTAGAGRWTTGPHLHFEVRVSGIPDDPLKYLPNYLP